MKKDNKISGKEPQTFTLTMSENWNSQLKHQEEYFITPFEYYLKFIYKGRNKLDKNQVESIYNRLITQHAYKARRRVTDPILNYNYMMKAFHKELESAEFFSFDVKERKVKVMNYDGTKMRMSDSWFVLDDHIINERTNKRYIVDFLSADKTNIGVVAKDEFGTHDYDIKEGDLFYIDRKGSLESLIK